MLYPAELRGHVQLVRNSTLDKDNHYRLAFDAVKQRRCWFAQVRSFVPAQPAGQSFPG
jgi:hypothetical protein